MMNRFCRSILLAALVASPICAYAQDAAPAAKPVFKTDMEKEALSKRLKELNPAQLIKDIEANPLLHQPVYRLILMVAKGSPAESLGVTPGCKAAMFSAEEGADGEFHWIDHKGTLHVSEVPPGKVGVDYFHITQLTNWYVFHGNRNAKWDAMVVAALQCQQKDTQLAGAMWAKALELGYPPDHLSNICGMAITMHRGDIPRAEAFAEAYGPIAKAPQPLLFPNAWHKLAALTADPKWWAKAADAFDVIFPGQRYTQDARSIAEVQAELAKKHAGKITKSPSELAEGMKRVSCLERKKRLVDAFWGLGVDDNFFNSAIDAAFEAEQKGVKEFAPMTSAMPLNVFTKGWTGPREKVTDMDVSITFKVKPLTRAGEAKSTYIRELILGFVNRNSKDQYDYQGNLPNGAQILTLSFNHEGYLQTRYYLKVQAKLPGRERIGRGTLHDNPLKPEVHSPSYLVPDESLDPEKFHTLRMVRVGPQVEAILDGKRVALAYVSDDRDETGFAIFRSGVEMSIKAFSAAALE